VADAKIDANWNPTATGVSSEDGETPTPVEVNPNTGRTLVDVDGMTAGVNYDTITADYPASNIEVYEYTLLGDLIRTKTVTYTDDSKRNIQTVVYS
jgi:hypothetical protein